MAAPTLSLNASVSFGLSSSPHRSASMCGFFGLPPLPQAGAVEGINSAPDLEHTRKALASMMSVAGGPLHSAGGGDRHRATSSASTLATSRSPDASPSDGRSSLDEAATGRPEQACWAITQTVRLGSERERDELAGRAKLVDKSTLCSVKSAIDQLNKGTLHCPEGLCVVYSASSLAYFLLFRNDKRDAVHAQFRKAGKELLLPLPLPQQGALVPAAPSAQQPPPPEEPFRTAHEMEASLMSSPVQKSASRPDHSPQALRSPQGSVRFCWTTGSPLHHSPSLTSRTGRGRLSTPSRSPGTLLQTTPSRLFTAPGSPKRDSQERSRPGGAQASPSASGLVRRSLPGSLARASASPAVQDGAAPSVFTPRTSKCSLGLVMSPQASPVQQRSSRKQLPSSPLPGSPLVSAEAPEPTAKAENSFAAALAVEASTHGTGTEPSANEVEIGNRFFDLIEIIGRGAFGVVWRALEVRTEATDLAPEDAEEGCQQEIAVKVVTARDNAGFVTAAFEAELLQILTATCSRQTQHVPQYFAHSATRSSAGGGYGTVRLAMSFVPGGALDKWLYGISDEEHKTVDVAQLVDGQLPGGQQGSWLLGGACSIVRELLFQLCGVFGALEPIAYHRDVSSHNVLVDFPQGPERPDFALIDFGLAVRSGSWTREWRNSNLAGDPRYWTPSAWMAFAFGFKYVATHPNTGFQQQYLTRMDHFSLGVLGLETLFALWHTGEAYEGKHPGLLEVRAAWAKYWAMVIRMFQMFHTQGAQEVRQYLAQAQEEGVTSLVDYLRQLRQALRAAAVHPQNVQCAALLLVIADLIDEKGTVAWSELPSMLGEDIQEEDSKDEACPVGRPSAALIESPVPTFERSAHIRIRSTGEALDQELQRFDPEVADGAAGCGSSGSADAALQRAASHGQCLSPDHSSRSFSHVRHTSNFV